MLSILKYHDDKGINSEKNCYIMDISMKIIEEFIIKWIWLQLNFWMIKLNFLQLSWIQFNHELSINIA